MVLLRWLTLTKQQILYAFNFIAKWEFVRQSILHFETNQILHFVYNKTIAAIYIPPLSAHNGQGEFSVYSITTRQRHWRHITSADSIYLVELYLM